MKPTSPKSRNPVASDELTVPVVEEQLLVSKRLVETAQVQLAKRVDLKDVHLDLERRNLGFTVERKVVNQLLDEKPTSTFQEGASTTYRVIEEVPTVVMKYRIVEEIVVTPEESIHSQPTVIPARREHVDIIRRPLNTNDPLL